MIRSVTVLELVAIIFGSTAGVGVLAAPRLAVEAGDTAGPLLALLSILLALFGTIVLTALGMRFPNESIVVYATRLIGRWPAHCLSICIIAYFATLTALSAREFGKIAVTAILPKTPVEVTTFVMIVLVAVAARNSVSTFSYIHLFYFPMIVAPVAFITILSLKNANLLYLQPVAGTQSLLAMASGSLIMAALLQGWFVLTIIIPAMRERHSAMKGTLIGVTLSGIVYLFTVMAALAVFGPGEIRLLYWPTLELAKTTLFPGEVLERLDGIFISVWVIAVFTSLYSSYYLTLEAFRQLLRLRDVRMCVLPFSAVVFFVAMLPPNIVQLYRVIKLVGQYGLILTIGYPCLLWIVARLRGIRDTGRTG